MFLEKINKYMIRNHGLSRNERQDERERKEEFLKNFFKNYETLKNQRCQKLDNFAWDQKSKNNKIANHYNFTCSPVPGLVNTNQLSLALELEWSLEKKVIKTPDLAFLHPSFLSSSFPYPSSAPHPQPRRRRLEILRTGVAEVSVHVRFFHYGICEGLDVLVVPCLLKPCQLEWMMNRNARYAFLPPTST